MLIILISIFKINCTNFQLWRLDILKIVKTLPPLFMHILLEDVFIKGR